MCLLFSSAGWTQNYECHKENGRTTVEDSALEDSTFVCEDQRRGALGRGDEGDLHVRKVAVDSWDHGYVSHAPKRHN